MGSLLPPQDTLLPPVIATDENMQVLATVAARLQQQNVNLVAVYDIDNAAPEVLPYLAEQWNMLGVKGWQFCRNDGERRAWLKNAYDLNRYKGTPWAIEEVLRVFNAGGTVKEWFEYEGQPYHFKVDVELYDRGLSETEYDATQALISVYKNVRSVLDGITLSLTGRMPLTMAAICHSGELTTIYPQQVAS